MGTRHLSNLNGLQFVVPGKREPDVDLSNDNGLQSVVSWRCEPDTITVRRACDDSLTIAHCQTGSKKTKVTMEGQLFQ